MRDPRKRRADVLVSPFPPKVTNSHPALDVSPLAFCLRGRAAASCEHPQNKVGTATIMGGFSRVPPRS